MLDLKKVLGDKIEDNTLYVESCRFKRENSSIWESGIVIDSGEGGFIDLNGNLLGEEEYLDDWKAAGLLIDAEMNIWRC